MASDQQATLVSNKILKVIQDSGLHFAIHLTPHSSYITIRKKFLSKEAKEQSLGDSISEGDSNSVFKYDELKKQLYNLHSENQVLKEMCVDLEEQTKHITAEAETKLENLHKHSEKISRENDDLKSAIAQLNDDNSKLSDNFKNATKQIKLNEKEIYNCKKQCENLKETNDNKKIEISRLKAEQTKLKSTNQKLEKKVNIKTSSKTATSQTQNFELENGAKLPMVDDSFTEFNIKELDDKASTISNPRPFFILSSSSIEASKQSALVSPKNPCSTPSPPCTPQPLPRPSSGATSTLASAEPQTATPSPCTAVSLTESPASTPLPCKAASTTGTVASPPASSPGAERSQQAFRNDIFRRINERKF